MKVLLTVAWSLVLMVPAAAVAGPPNPVQSPVQGPKAMAAPVQAPVQAPPKMAQGDAGYRTYSYQPAATGYRSYSYQPGMTGARTSRGGRAFESATNKALGRVN